MFLFLQGEEIVGTVTTGESNCTFSTAKTGTEALTSEDYQVTDRQTNSLT